MLVYLGSCGAELPQCIFNLLLPGFNLFSGINQLIISILDFLLSVLQLLFGVRQFLLRFSLPIFIFFFAVQIFLIAILIFLFSVLLQVLKSLLSEFFRLRFDSVDGIIQSVIVPIGINGIRPGDSQGNFRIIIDIKRIFQDIVIVFQGSAANSGCSPVAVHVQRCCHAAHDGKRLFHKRIQGILIIFGGNGHRLPQKAVLPVESVSQTLSGVLRHPSASQRHLADGLRQRVKAVNRLLLGCCLSNQVHPDNAFGILHLIHGGKFLHILRAPAVIAYRPDIVHILLVHELLTGRHHVSLRHQKTGKQAGSQCNNRRNGDVPPKRFQNGLAQIGAHCISFHYHSISAIFCGCSFIVTEETVPFFTRITRSAMEVNALLWVMMIMVIPVFRPVS